MYRRKNRNATPTISVIIPACNEEHYLPLCLKALTKQRTSIPFEVIVVDNNSTDNTASIPQQFGYTLIHESKKGASAARNAGAKKAKGSLLVFIDADCIPSRDHIEKIGNYWMHHPQTACMTGIYIYKDASPFLHWLTEGQSYYSHMFTVQKLLFGLHGLLGGNFAITRRTYREIGGFNERLNHVIMAEDTELARRVTDHGYSTILNKDLKVASSSRRLRRAPLSLALIRTYYVVKHLLSRVAS